MIVRIDFMNGESVDLHWMLNIHNLVRLLVKWKFKHPTRSVM